LQNLQFLKPISAAFFNISSPVLKLNGGGIENNLTNKRIAHLLWPILKGTHFFGEVTR
jgi:hypothetical protein